MKKKVLSILLCGIMAFGCLAGCGDSAGKKETAKKDASETEAETAAKQETEVVKSKAGGAELTLMITNSTDPWAETVKEMVEKKFPDYSLTFKNWDEPTVEQTVKTAFAADQAMDVVMYWPTYMKKFEGTGIPMDLTKYMEEDTEWKDGFTDGILEVGKTDEGLLAIPNTTNYPMLQVNKKLFEDAGVEFKDVMTWDEFMAACEKIKASGKTPVAVQQEWAGWFVRNALLQCWDNKEELDSFIAGNIPFTDERVKNAMDNIADMYNSDYVYPGGKEAVTTSADDAMAAFINGDAAIFCNVVANAKSVSEKVGDKFELGVISWPGMAKTDDMNNLLGSAGGYMIMSNTKYPEEAVEILKYLTGTEVLQAMADQGAIVANKNVTSDDANYQLYSRDADKVYPDEVINLSSEIFDNLVYNEPANYLFNGESALDELEALREAAAAK